MRRPDRHRQVGKGAPGFVSRSYADRGPRSHPDGFSVNFRCLDSTDGFEVTINPFDGRDWERNAHALAHKSKDPA